MIEQNLNKIIYTMRHRQALKKIIEKYCIGIDKDELLKRAEYHDMDKVVLLTMMNSKLASNIHRNYIRHHIESKSKNLNRFDYLEMIMDWECARYTKEDKPRNAYDTMKDFYMELEKDILPILKELKLDHSNNGLILDNEIYNEIKKYNITKEQIEDEIKKYIDNYKNSENYEKYEVLDLAIKTYEKVNK